MERFGFTEDLAQRLLQTPASVEEMINHLRQQELVGGQWSDADVINPPLEGFLHTYKERGIEKVTTQEELRHMLLSHLEFFENGIPWRLLRRSRKVLQNVFMDVKSHRFAQELPPAAFEEQVTINQKEIDAAPKDLPEIDELHDLFGDLDEYIDKHHEEIQKGLQAEAERHGVDPVESDEQYSPMEISLIEDRAKLLLRDLFSKR